MSGSACKVGIEGRRIVSVSSRYGRKDGRKRGEMYIQKGGKRSEIE